MSEWPEVRIADHASIDIGGTPSRAIPAFWAEKPSGYPWISIADLKGKFVSDTKEHITALGVRSSNVKLIPEGTTVMSFKLSVGRTAITAAEMYCNEAIAIFQPKDRRLDGRWLYHALPLAAGSVVTDTAVKGATLNKAKMAEMTLRLPSPAEQTEIAEVLDTLDTAIHETEAIIAKLQAVKQGMLHDLLTRGIDANGELRPPQTEAPHLYKPSPLGWIPKGWEAHVFGHTIEHIIDFRGRTPKKLGMDWGGGDILALSANNVQPGAIDISREAYVGGERLYRKWMTNGDVRKGDVLLTMEAPLGNVAQIPDDARYILSQRVIALRFSAGVVLNDFAFWQMQCHEFQQAIVRRSTGSTATGIQRAELVKLHFKAPPVQEQSLIADRLASIEHKLEGERLALAKQVQQKAGLMDDLLAGRVRVTHLLEEAERAKERA